MNEEKAHKILNEHGTSVEADRLSNGQDYLSYSFGEKYITLDANFDADTLEALVWFMRNKK